jgi:hypothetical protein
MELGFYAGIYASTAELLVGGFNPLCPFSSEFLILILGHVLSGLWCIFLILDWQYVAQ